MDKLTLINFLKSESTETLSNIVKSIWLASGDNELFEPHMVSKTDANLTRIINEFGSSAIDIAKKNGSYLEDDKWIGVYGNSVYTRSDESYKRSLLEAIWNKRFREAIVKYVRHTDRGTYPECVITYAISNKNREIEKSTTND